MAGSLSNVKLPTGFTQGESRFISLFVEKYGGRKEDMLAAVTEAYNHTNYEASINQLRLLKKKSRVMNEIEIKLGHVTDLSNIEDLSKELLRRARDENETPTMRRNILANTLK